MERSTTVPTTTGGAVAPGPTAGVPGQPTAHGRAAVDALLAGHDAPIWLDLRDPSDDDLRWLEALLRLDALAVDDVRRAGRRQRAMIEHYDGHAFLVLFVPEADRLVTLSVFVTPRVVCTVHRDACRTVAAARTRWADALGAGHVRASDTDVGLYCLLDTTVDAYFPVVDALGAEVGAAERRVFAGGADGTIVQDLAALRARVAAQRAVLAPMRDVLLALVRRELDTAAGERSRYFMDVAEHMERIVDALDAVHDQVGSTLDAHATLVSMRLNETMRTMTALATILMVGTLVAGVYGMNFRAMPELEWAYGYPYAVALMIVLMVAVASVFRRRGWL